MPKPISSPSPDYGSDFEEGHQAEEDGAGQRPVKETYNSGTFGGFDGGDMEQMDPGRGIYTPSDERSVGSVDEGGEVGGTDADFTDRSPVRYDDDYGTDRSPVRYDDDDYGFGNDDDEYGNEDIPMNDLDDDYEQSEGNAQPSGGAPLSPQSAARGYVDEQDFNDDFEPIDEPERQAVQNTGYAAVRDPSDSASSEVDNVSSQVQSDASNSGKAPQTGAEVMGVQDEVGTDFGDEFSDFEPE
jgi:hypothetical protein